MAKKKSTNIGYLLRDTLSEFEEWKKKNPIVETKYVVLEKAKVWYDNEYGDRHGGQTIRQFDFPTTEERDQWLMEHDPDDRHEFVKQTYYLRLVTPEPYKQWFYY